MNIHIAGPIVALALLAGCALEPAAPDVPLSPAQAYYAAERTYESMLEAAVDYKDNCVSRPVPLQAQCYPVVKILRDLNREAQMVREYAEIAITDGDFELLPEATNALEDLRDKLREKVLAQMEADAELKKGATP